MGSDGMEGLFTGIMLVGLAHVLPPWTLAIPLTYRNSGQAVSMAWHSGEVLLVRNLNGNLWQYIS